jgi:hypothetical protein
MYRTLYAAFMRERVRTAYGGRIPITKNIAVADAWGNPFGSTFIRRAKGLVKNGRARWVDEHSIRLTRPPESDSEDEIMNDNNMNSSFVQFDNNGAVMTLGTSGSAAVTPGTGSVTVTSGTGGETVSAREILDRISAISAESAYVNDALNALNALQAGSGAQSSDGYGVQGKAEAIANVVQARETTNQQMLRLLEKMYDNTQTPKDSGTKSVMVDDAINRFKAVIAALEQFRDNDGDYPGEILETITTISRKIFEM